MHRYIAAAVLMSLFALMLGVGIAHAQLFPNAKSTALNVSISTPFQTVPVGSVCNAGACSTPSQADIEACAYGGKAPYYMVVYNNNQQVASAGIPGCYYYTFTPQSPGTYAIKFKATDSSATPNTATGSAIISATQQSGGGPLAASLSLEKADVNVSHPVQIGINIQGGVAPYSIKTYANGQLISSANSYSPYTYSFLPSATGEYVLDFKISDLSGHTANQSAVLYALPGGLPYIGSSSKLTVSMNPAYDTVEPGTPVTITATASGGNSTLYDMILTDGYGDQLATSQTGSISYTYTPYQAGTYYPITAVVYGTGHQVAQQTAYIKTTPIVSTNGQLNESVTPLGISADVGQQAHFNVTPSGGLAPYYLVIRDQYGNLVKTAQLNNTKPYEFSTVGGTPGSFSFDFVITDSLGSAVSKTATLVATGGAVSSAQHNYGTINATPGQSISVTVSPRTYPCPCSVLVYNNGQYQQVGEIAAGSSYTYSFVPPVPGTYSISFLVQYTGANSMGYSESLLYDVYASTSAVENNANLTLSVSPQYTIAAAPGSAVQITATATGGNSALYNIVVYDGNGNVLASSTANWLSYSYTVPSPAGSYYPITVEAYDASHHTVSHTVYIYAS